MLTAYENATQQLFQALTSPIPLIPTAVLDGYINSARNQVAAEGECVRNNATVALIPGIRNYPFSGFSASSGNTVLAIRSGYIVAQPQPLEIRPWEWFAAYYGFTTDVGIPSIAAQQGQGTAGNVVFFPIPSAPLTAAFDSVQLPQALINDTTIETIPYPWTDAVPFYAAWLAMMNAQRQADADMMFQRYEQIIMRLARMGATPSELPSSMPNDRGLQMQRAG